MEAALRLLVIALVPSAVAAAVLWLPRVVAALRRLQAGGQEPLRPEGPPLEQLAAELRRLVAEHEHVRRSSGLPVRAARLAALEGAITDSAVAAARALGVEPPPHPGRAPQPVPDLRRLLTDLAASGLVLPPAERFGR